MRKFLIILLFFTQLSFAQIFWESYGNMTRPVAGGDIWQNADNLYIVGGHSDSVQSDVNWVQTFNVGSQSWYLDSMNTARFGLVVQSYNNLAYFFGGIQNENKSITDIERWGLDNTYNSVFDSNDNFNRIFSTGQIVGNNFYIIGGNPLPGTGSDTLAYIIEYNLEQSKITYKLDTLFTNGDFPYQQMSAVIDDDIYIFGGALYTVSQDIYKFNTTNHSYEKLPIKLLEPRAGGRVVKGFVPNSIYIIGGYNENSAALKSVEYFYKSGDQYFIQPNLPIQEARYNFMAANFNNSLYIMGGYDKEGKVISSIEKLEEYAATVVEGKDNSLPTKFELKQNFPNPFNPTTTIEYSIPMSNKTYQSLQLTVYDILGNKITELVNGINPSGTYSVEFNANDYPSGVYYYQLKSGSFVQTKKMLLLK